MFKEKKFTLRLKHCVGDCFWRSVDGAANLKPISFFTINAAPNSSPVAGRWKLSGGSARYRGNCGDFLAQEIAQEIAPISQRISQKKKHKK